MPLRLPADCCQRSCAATEGSLRRSGHTKSAWKLDKVHLAETSALASGFCCLDWFQTSGPSFSLARCSEFAMEDTIPNGEVSWRFCARSPQE